MIRRTDPMIPAWFLIAHCCQYKKGDPPADLRDADGFCYRLIRTVLSENLLIFGCKYNAFLAIMQFFSNFLSKDALIFRFFTIFATAWGRNPESQMH